MKKHKLSSTFCSFTPVLLCCRSYSQTRLPSIKACLFYKGTLVALESSSSPCSLWFIAPGLTALRLSLVTLMYHQRNGSSIALQSVSSPYCQPPRLAASCLTALQSVSSPYSQPARLAASCLTALQSVSSPYSQYRHLAVSLLALLLVALKSASQPCNQPRRLAVDLVTLLLAPSPCSC